VNEVEGSLDICRRKLDRRNIIHIAEDVNGPVVSIARVPRHRQHVVAIGHKSRHKVLADKATTTGNEDPHCGPLPVEAAADTSSHDTGLGPRDRNARTAHSPNLPGARKSDAHSSRHRQPYGTCRRADIGTSDDLVERRSALTARCARSGGSHIEGGRARSAALRYSHRRQRAAPKIVAAMRIIDATTIQKTLGWLNRST
jgi:hypothetical protein